MTGYPIIDAVLIFGSIAAVLAFGTWAVMSRGGAEDGE